MAATGRRGRGGDGARGPSTASAGAAGPVVARTETLYVAPSQIQGVGVFAARPIAADELVECCPVVVCPPEQEGLLERTELCGLYFTWKDDAIGLALGFGSLYNHAWEPNAWYDIDHDLEVVRFFAVRPIAEGEEITINYTGHPDGRDEIWFDPL